MKLHRADAIVATANDLTLAIGTVSDAQFCEIFRRVAAENGWRMTPACPKT